MFKRLKGAMLVLLGRMKPIPEGYVVIQQEKYSKRQSEYDTMLVQLHKLQEEYTYMTDTKESIRRKLRKERMLTGNLLSVVDYVLELWTVDAYPSGESMLYAMQFLQEELNHWDSIKRLDYKELQAIREECIDEQEFRDKIHRVYQELKEQDHDSGQQ